LAQRPKGVSPKNDFCEEARSPLVAKARAKQKKLKINLAKKVRIGAAPFALCIVVLFNF